MDAESGTSMVSIPSIKSMSSIPRAFELLLLAALLPASGCSREAPAALPPGGVEQEIGASETRVYDLGLAAGEYVELAVEQRGVDVAAAVLDPGGRELFRVDSPNGDRGPEPVLFVADAAGLYRLRIEAGARSGGRYAVLVAAKRPANDEDRRRAGAAAAFRRAEELRRAASPEDLGALEEALRQWQDLDDRFWLAEVWDRLGRVHGRRGEWTQAADAHRRAAALFEARGDPRREAAAWDMMGEAFQKLGDADRAVAAVEKALGLWRQAGDRRGEAVSWNDLGLLHQESGRLQRALDAYGAAFGLWRELGREDWQAVTLHNLGLVHTYLGRDQRAFDLFGAAAAVFARGGADDRRLAPTLDQIGRLLIRRGDHEAALDHLQRALALRRKYGDRPGEAYTLTNLARLRLLEGRSEAAAGLYEQALSIFVESGDRWGEALVGRGLGAIALAGGRPRDAMTHLRAGLAAVDGTGALLEEAEIRVRLAAAERAAGDLAAAREHLERGLELFAGLRRSVASHELRAAWSASLEEHYGAYVDLLMELDARQPGHGFAARAFAASERSRAQALLELLEAARERPRREADPELLERERQVQEELNGLERLSLGLFDGPPAGEERRAAWDARRRALVEGLNEIRGRLHAGRHATAEGEPGGEALGVDDIRARVLDGETLLLEVELAKERSFLWVVGTDRFESHVLGPGDEIEEAARAAHRLLSVSYRRESVAAVRAALCRLSRLVLAPALEGAGLDGRRLVVVTEGALQYVPFAALPLPSPGCRDAGSEPLLAGHEIVQLPSASVLAVLSRAAPRATDEVAVFADPVFSPSDPRVAAGSGEAEPAPRLRRLAYSRREGETILALAAPRKTRLAAGFAAAKAAVLDGGLESSGVLHFATHGILDPAYPELSSLVLSRVDENGAPVDGTLYAHEVYDLHFSAELVVLSACRTALGGGARGEGLMGLPQSFLYAGARRVLVSLWDVDDRVTAELMELFYRALFEDGLAPAAALRRAQLDLRRTAGRQAPYFWAAFVLLGEWKATGF